MGSTKTQELRTLMGLAIKLRVLAEDSEDYTDTELFLSAALALEDRAKFLAFGPAPEALAPAPRVRLDIIC